MWSCDLSTNDSSNVTSVQRAEECRIECYWAKYFAWSHQSLSSGRANNSWLFILKRTSSYFIGFWNIRSVGKNNGRVYRNIEAQRYKTLHKQCIFFNTFRWYHTYIIHILEIIDSRFFRKKMRMRRHRSMRKIPEKAIKLKYCLLCMTWGKLHAVWW